jgi:putative oxygen-independent coproporphyrinogen III oxidase
MLPLSIYIHWPFCASLCPYCDFNSHVSKNIDHDTWAAAYISELRYWHAELSKREIVSVFFGGGTPSLMQPMIVENVLAEIARLWPLTSDCEITLEANPGSVEARKLRDFARAGINRVSIGVQSLNDAALKFLGRRHARDEALVALKIARETFARVSADFIYARAGQTTAAWHAELDEILSLKLDHLSLYQLTIEAGTPFYMRAQKGERMTADDNAGAEMFELTQSLCNAANLPAYEISNHARAGQASRHNLAYWQYDDYVGIGPGAHGRVTLDGTKHSTTTHRAPKIYLERVAANGHALHAPKKLSTTDMLQEMMLMGLRLTAGIPKEKIARYAGQNFDLVLPPEKLLPFITEKLLWVSDDAIGATPQGAMKLNALTKAILDVIARE